MSARRRGFALADFIAGTVILAGVVATWAAMTRGQIDLAATADRRARALYAAEEALARFRSRPDGAARAAQMAPADGSWGELERFEVATLRGDAKVPVGRLDVRRVRPRAQGFEPGDALEVRARLEWRTGTTAPDRLWISTVLPGRAP